MTLCSSSAAKQEKEDDLTAKTPTPKTATNYCSFLNDAFLVKYSNTTQEYKGVKSHQPKAITFNTEKQLSGCERVSVQIHTHTQTCVAICTHIHLHVFVCVCVHVCTHIDVIQKLAGYSRFSVTSFATSTRPIFKWIHVVRYRNEATMYRRKNIIWTLDGSCLNPHSTPYWLGGFGLN